MAVDPNDPYSAYRPLNQEAFSPTASGGGFSEWLSSLPSAQQLSPTGTYITGRRGETGVGPNQVPAMWLQFAPHAASLINQAAIARRGAATAGAANSRREFERALLSGYQSQGVNPMFARRQLAESAPQVGYQLQQQLGGIEADRLQQTLQLQTGVQNALAQSYAGERQMSFEAYLASRARKAARQGAKSAMTSQLLGAGLGAAATIFGGPAGAALFGAGQSGLGGGLPSSDGIPAQSYGG